MAVQLYGTLTRRVVNRLLSLVVSQVCRMSAPITTTSKTPFGSLDVRGKRKPLPRAGSNTV